MNRHISLIVLLMLVPLIARAERPTTQGEDLSTPKKALMAFDRVGADPHVERATFFYAAKTEDEKKVAESLASVDLALAKFRKSVSTRFDRDAGDRMVHALRDVNAEDIEAATEKIEGDKATVSGKGFGDPLKMVKVNGAWKISVADMLADSNGTPDEIAGVCEALVDAIDQTQEELAADKYVNVSLLERAVKRRVKGILGGD